jgi:hypothetical protein
MAITLLPLLLLDPQDQFGAFVATLVLHAVAASTQDAAIDAYAIGTITAEERGTINAFMQGGMLLGRGAFGGSTLVVISLLGFSGAVLALVVVLLAIAVGVLVSTELPTPAETSVGGGLRVTLGRVWEALKDRGTRAGFLVALVAGCGFEGVGAVAGPYLVDRGYEAVTIGLFFAVVTTPAMLLGAFLGGRMADHGDRASIARRGLLLIAAVILALVLTDPLVATQGGVERIVILGMLYLGIGFFTTSSYALFMDLTDPKIGATQFSAYMGATNLCEAWSALAVGRIASALGYPVAFAALGIASLLSLPGLRVLQVRPPRGGPHGSASQEPG